MEAHLSDMGEPPPVVARLWQRSLRRLRRLRLHLRLRRVVRMYTLRTSTLRRRVMAWMHISAMLLVGRFAMNFLWPRHLTQRGVRHLFTAISRAGLQKRFSNVNTAVQAKSLQISSREGRSHQRPHLAPEEAMTLPGMCP